MVMIQLNKVRKMDLVEDLLISYFIEAKIQQLLAEELN